MNQDITDYVTNCHQCHVIKDHYTGLQTQQGLLVASNPLDLLCIDFLKVDPSRDGKENILVLTDAFTKFSQAFITNSWKALTIAKTLSTSFSMSMVFWPTFTVIRAEVLKMPSYLNCTPCITSSSL